MEKFPYDFSTAAIGHVYTAGETDRSHKAAAAASAAMDALSHWTA